MASFTFNFRIQDGDGDGVLSDFQLASSGPVSGTMSDGNASDENFNLGERWIVAGDAGGLAGDYQGSVVINGEAFFVFLS